MGLKDKLREKFYEREERKYADYDYRMEQFEICKNFFFSDYENGVGIDDEENCKGNINNSYASAVAGTIPPSYRDEFLEYLKEDKKFLALLGQKKSSTSHNDEDEEISELKNKLNKEREDGILAVVGFVIGVLGKRRRDLIKPYLTEEEKNLCTEIFQYKKELYNVVKEKNTLDSIKYSKDWYAKTNYKYKEEILRQVWCDLGLFDDGEHDKEFDEIIESKPNKISEKIDSESSTVSDIKAKLEKLKSLKEDGLISEEDFQKKKSELLDLI